MKKELCILLVDDDEVDREMVSKALKVLSPVIVEARTGTECLFALTQQQFSLIILDYKLPDIDGLPLISEIKQKYPNIPIVVITGFGNEDIVMVTREAGVLDYIPKAKITPEFLVRTILNDLLIHKSQLDLKHAEEMLKLQRERDSNTLMEIIKLAKDKLSTYEPCCDKK